MTNVTYLLGAGASANVIPTVNKIEFENKVYSHGLAHEIHMCAIKLKEIAEVLKHESTVHTLLERCKRFTADLDWLSAKASEYGSVDTYAKKLFFQNETSELERLKRALSVFLALIQEEKGTDYRYSSFLSKILQKGNFGAEFPPQVKILSWNYDVQFELSLKKFFSK